MDKDILSSKEIEALVNVEGERDYKGKTVYPYDFRSPEVLSREKFKIFQILMDEFCKNLREFLSSHYRLNLDAEISSIHQGAYEEIQDSDEQAFLAVFEAPPLEGHSILDIKIPFVLFFSQVILGHMPESFPSPRHLTPVEEEAGRNLAKRFLICLQEAFRKLVDFSAEIVSLEKNPKLLFLASPHEPVIMVNINFSKGDSSSEVKFYLPYIVFDSLLPYLDFKKWFFITQRKKNEATDKLIKDNIEKMEMDLVSELGSLDVTLQDLLNLEEGDYLRLNTSKDSLLDLKIGGLGKFKAKPGLVGKRIALKIEKMPEE
ncbi:MAG: hypothetical protein GF375_06720 [Candidatus Omnitrophica bacterium]|nr:hypothetical protein [Candidatus Omnitrophota bacterium]MBD3269667.1 hypothetical protein [Candidatus Omnitrophota bacterium]